MSIAADDTYSAPSGATVRGGRFNTPSWVRALPLWQWYEIPNTALSSVAPSPKPSGGTGPKSKIESWCGATLKRVGSVYMLGAAGGHGDYHGNEVNALALNVETPEWAELLGPTPTEDIIKSTSVYLDYRRSSIHTYSATQFDQVRNRMLIVAGGGPHGTAPPPNAPDDWPWLTGYHPKVIDSTYPISSPLMGFDLDTNSWTHPDDLAPIPFDTSGTDAVICANPLTGDVYVKPAGWGTFWRYSTAEDTWTPDVGNIGYGLGRGSAVDPTRDRLICVGGTSTGLHDPVVLDLTTGALASVEFGGLGPEVLRSPNGHCGVVYDETNDVFVALKNTGTTSVDVIETYIIDAATFEVRQPGDVGTKPTRRPNGIHNAVQYAPELRGIVIANSYTGNVQFMRTAN